MVQFMRKWNRMPVLTLNDNARLIEESNESRQKRNEAEKKVQELMKGFEESKAVDNAALLYEKTY